MYLQLFDITKYWRNRRTDRDNASCCRELGRGRLSLETNQENCIVEHSHEVIVFV